MTGAVIEVWLNDLELGLLKEAIKYFDDQQDKDFEGKAYLRGRRGMGITRRKRINNSYVVREALGTLSLQIAKVRAEEKREREANAVHTYVNHGLHKRSGEQQPENRWGEGNDEQPKDRWGRTIQESNAIRAGVISGFGRKSDEQRPKRKWGKGTQALAPGSYRKDQLEQPIRRWGKGSQANDDNQEK